MWNSHSWNSKIPLPFLSPQSHFKIYFKRDNKQILILMQTIKTIFPRTWLCEGTRMVNTQRTSELHLRSSLGSRPWLWQIHVVVFGFRLWWMRSSDSSSTSTSSISWRSPRPNWGSSGGLMSVRPFVTMPCFFKMSWKIWWGSHQSLGAIHVCVDI